MSTSDSGASGAADGGTQPPRIIPDLDMAASLASSEAPLDEAPAAPPPAEAAPAPAAPPAPPRGPLGNLALSFSGGGYRAAGFHLGVLSLLDRMRLLPSVVALSTVSGGTITGAAWVVSLLDGRPFADFFAGFGAFLKKTNVIGDALARLTGHRSGHRGERPSLIRAAASVYADTGFMGDRRLGEVLQSKTLPLDEVIFNSTEFHTGIDFRFRRSANPRALIGNGNFPVPPDVAAHVRLADAVAASSCFPSAFEPFVFPDEFTWTDAFPLSAARAALPGQFADGLPLMDGGVYDNQGVGALQLTYRNVPEPPVLLISDTSPPTTQLFAEPKAGRRGFLPLWVVNWIGWAVLIATAFSAVALGVRVFDEWRAHQTLFVDTVGCVTCAVVAIAMIWARIQIGNVGAILKSDVQVSDAWRDLRRLTVAELITLVSLRVMSLMALTSSIFMKRVRELILSSVYADDRYKGRRMANLIYSLAGTSGLFKQYPWLKPTAGLQKLATDASNVGTALWLTDAAQLDLLVKAGEATTCFSLLKFILQMPADQQQKPDVQDLFGRLRQEWATFNV